SVASARALARESNLEDWEYIKKEFFLKEKTGTRPLIFSNFINGGVHAQNNLSIQEYIVIAETSKSYSSTIRKLVDLYRDIGDTLRSTNWGSNVSVGDEGGFATSFADNFEPLTILGRGIKRQKMEKEFRLGMDAAASEFMKEGFYEIDGKKLKSKELTKMYKEYFSASPSLVSVEDPFAEDDTEGFKALRDEVGEDKLLVGDDLTVTSAELIEKSSKAGLINGVIIKPNQVGTITEACLAVRAAKEKGIKTIVSHRSGETEDNFIIHLAKACNADGVKIGAPQKERILKFNELIRLYD
ncbi:MAG: phosphopyruvate hydratase, partial [Patescibacteria group bacterium]